MNPLFLRHRVNSIQDISFLKEDWGVEIDIRSCVDSKGSLHLSHDPWVRGDDFETWLSVYKKRGIQGPIWLNTKEDGLEDRVEELMNQYGIRDYVFLDTVLPTLVKRTQFLNQPQYAIRFSAFEPLEFVNLFQGKADWVWVDCFQGAPVGLENVLRLKDHFKICLVSPELHGKKLSDHLVHFKSLFEISDAICSKDPSLWQSYFS